MIWRESKGVFTALDKKGVIRAWVIGTGKITKSDITTNSINLKDYALYECNKKDDTYKHNWQQHPERTITLLKQTRPLQYYDP